MQFKKSIKFKNETDFDSKQNGIISNESCRRIKLVKIQNMGEIVAANNDNNNNNTSKESHNV